MSLHPKFKFQSRPVFLKCPNSYFDKIFLNLYTFLIIKQFYQHHMKQNQMKKLFISLSILVFFLVLSNITFLVLFLTKPSTVTDIISSTPSINSLPSQPEIDLGKTQLLPKSTYYNLVEQQYSFQFPDISLNKYDVSKISGNDYKFQNEEDTTQMLCTGSNSCGLHPFCTSGSSCEFYVYVYSFPLSTDKTTSDLLEHSRTGPGSSDDIVLVKDTVDINGITFDIRLFETQNQYGRPLGSFHYSYGLPISSKLNQYLVFSNIGVTKENFENKILGSIKITPITEVTR